jgi:cytochrome c oxidase subunit 2
MAAAAVVFLAACADDAPQDTLEPAGPVARKIDGLWDVTFWIAAIIFLIVEALLVYAVIRYRRRPGHEDDVPPQVHGNTKLELGWTLAPAVILMGLAIPTVALVLDLGDKPEGEQVLKVEVLAQQFWWEYRYGQFEGDDLDVVTANELHIPADRDVVLTLKSDDVIHSFWVPKLAGKQDVVPGRTHEMLIHADRPGAYEGQCVEFCGLSHANMRLRVFAHPEEEFLQWVRDQRRPAAEPAEGTLAAEGQELFTAQCGSCHTVDGVSEGEVGPNLTHFASRTTFAGAIFENTPGNLKIWLRNPPEAKPGAKMPNLNLREPDIDALVAYLTSLS